MNISGSTIIVAASAVAVIYAIFRLIKAIVNIAIDLRDNKNATLRNTEALKELSSSVDGRMTKIEDWIKNHDAKRQP